MNDPVARANTLGEEADRALDEGCFAEVAPLLRQAIRELPAELRYRVELTARVWEALIIPARDRAGPHRILAHLADVDLSDRVQALADLRMALVTEELGGTHG